MQEFINVLALFCLGLSLTFFVLISVGWLTCTDYYFKIADFCEGWPVFMVFMTTGIFSTITMIVYIFINDTIFIPPLYINMGIWIMVGLCAILVYFSTYICQLRKYFAKKRGRYL